MNSDELKNVLLSNIGECQTKLELINDYLERFQIRDSRITAPVFDIDRCISMMVHIIDHENSDSRSFSDGEP